jgi:hypothetical protein
LQGKECQQYQREMKALIDWVFQYGKEDPAEQSAWFLEPGDWAQRQSKQ